MAMRKAIGKILTFILLKTASQTTQYYQFIKIPEDFFGWAHTMDFADMMVMSLQGFQTGEKKRRS